MAPIVFFDFGYFVDRFHNFVDFFIKLWLGARGEKYLKC